MADQDKASILIQHGTIISMDPALGIMRDCDILIEGNTIVKVSSNITAPSGARIIDATNCLVSPGYVDCHHHLWQQLLRSVGSDWTLMDYVLIMRTCFGSLYTADDVYTANYAGCVDLLHNGITTVVDHCHILNSPQHADAAVRALKDARIRGAFCYGLYANPPLLNITDDSTLNTADPAFTPAARRADLRRVLAQHFADASGSANSGSGNTWESSLLVCGLATNEPETAGAAGIAAEIAFARSAELRLPLITSHVAIGHYDISQARVVQHLGDADELGPDLLFSHGAAWTDAECALLARSGVGIVSTPETELQMGMGHPVAFRAMDRFGCGKVGLGVDVTCSQNNDMVAQARLLLQAQRARDNEEAFKKSTPGRPPLTCPRKAVDVLRLATQGGADALGIGHLVGSLTPGKRADVVVTACDGLGMVPAVDPVGMLVCNSNASDIRTVLVDGRVVKDEGKVVGVDWEALREDVRKRSERLVRASQVILPELMKGISKEEDDFDETLKKVTEALAMGANSSSG